MSTALVLLGDIATLQAGFGFPPSLQGRTNGRYPFAKVGDISRGGRSESSILSKADHYVDAADVAALRAKIVPPGSILFAKIGEAIRQNHRVVAGCEMLIDNNAMAAIPNARVDSRFLYHYLKTVDFYCLAPATTVPALRKSDLERLQVPLPPLPEQRRIAAILDQADALRAKRREALAQLDSLTQSIFIEMFGDPATNPKGWPAATLGDFIFTASDGPHVSPPYSETGIPFLSTRHVRPGEISWSDLKYLAESDAAVQWKKCRPQRGDILYTKGGTTGLAAAVRTDTPFAVWVHVALLKPNPSKVETEWLESMLNAEFCYRQSQDLTHGIANRDLGLKRMTKIRMYSPPLSLQREFVERKERVNSIRATSRLALAELDALFASLQHRAFAGQLL